MSPARPSPPRTTLGALAFSFVHAWTGLVHTVVHQRNMRVHLVSAILVGLVGSGIPLGLAEKVTLIFCVLFVFFAEILNSALEQLVDLAVEQLDERARLTKDAAAAGVLVLTLGTVVIFAALLVHNWQVILEHGPQIRRQVFFVLPLAAISATLAGPHLRKVWLDTVLFACAVALWAMLLLTSKSYVFSAMTLGLVVLAFAAGFHRRSFAHRAGAA